MHSSPNSLTPKGTPTFTSKTLPSSVQGEPAEAPADKASLRAQSAGLTARQQQGQHGSKAQPGREVGFVRRKKGPRKRCIIVGEVKFEVFPGHPCKHGRAQEKGQAGLPLGNPLSLVGGAPDR